MGQSSPCLALENLDGKPAQPGQAAARFGEAFKCCETAADSCEKQATETTNLSNRWNCQSRPLLWCEKMAHGLVDLGMSAPWISAVDNRSKRLLVNFTALVLARWGVDSRADS